MTKVFIAVPSYNGSIEVGTCSSLINNIKELEKNNHEVTLHFECGNPYIVQARNLCVGYFRELRSDFLVFVDSDLAFDKDAILKMIDHNKDIVCGAYPFKVGNYGYPIKVNCNEDQTPMVDMATGLISIQGGPTGLMCIKSGVIEYLIDKNPMWETDHVTNVLGNKVYAIFDTGILRERKKWYGEDYLFCLRAIESGFSIWLEPRITFDHIGKHCVSGNYHKYLLEQPQPKKA
jgi:GT2 family glycosyltransferase